MFGKLLTALLLSLTMLGANAMIKTQNFTLDNDLGTATLYSKADSKAGPGVIVIHEWWGLNDYAKGRAKQLAELGFSAVVVDMYGHGKVAQHPKDAKGFMMAATKSPEKMNARFNAAKAILAKQSNVDNSKLYAIGYCFGGAVVLNQARLGNDLAGVVSFHGSLSSELVAEKGKVKAKVLVAHGGADPFVPAEQVTGFVQEMLAAEVDMQLLNYPNATHSFTNPDADEKGKKFDMPLAYDAYADKDSWQAMLNFISK